MRLSEKEISIDPEGIRDAPRNSLFAGIAAALGVVGIFAIVAPIFSWFSLASVICSLIVLGFARYWDLSKLSVNVALACVYCGLFSGLAGAVYQVSHDWIIQRKAIEVAAEYIHALADGDRTSAIKMTGLPPLVSDADLEGQKASREQSAVRNFLADPTIQEVLKRGRDAAWKSTGVLGVYRTEIVLEITVGFIDESLTNPRPVIITVKMIPPTKYSPETRNQWYIESINQAPL